MIFELLNLNERVRECFIENTLFKDKVTVYNVR